MQTRAHAYAYAYVAWQDDLEQSVEANLADRLSAIAGIALSLLQVSVHAHTSCGLGAGSLLPYSLLPYSLLPYSLPSTRTFYIPVLTSCVLLTVSTGRHFLGRCVCSAQHAAGLQWAGD